MKQHLLTYALSASLTALAFAAVLYGGLSAGFVLPFLVALGFVQAAVQLFFWMHLKERGHAFAAGAIAFGAVIALIAAAAAAYWTRW